jgi:hypothetical protein
MRAGSGVASVLRFRRRGGETAFRRGAGPYFLGASGVPVDDVALVEDDFLLFLVVFFACLVDGLAIDSLVVVVAVVVVVAGAAVVAAGAAAAGAGAAPWAAAVAAKARATRAVKSLLMKPSLMNG